jgi:hypothetical protein
VIFFTISAIVLGGTATNLAHCSFGNVLGTLQEAVGVGDVIGVLDWLEEEVLGKSWQAWESVLNSHDWGH